jgi:hypothetical protein
MTFTVWRRHNSDICASTNRYEPQCGCPLHVQFIWKGAPCVFEGKKLVFQNKWSLNTRSWSEAQSKVADLETRLKNFSEGKVVPKDRTIEAALREWYEFREQNKLGNTKAKQVGGKHVEWCEKNNILLLTAFTTEKAMKWRVTLPYRTGTSPITSRSR